MDAADYAIQSDGRTVWVHTDAGTIARFGPNGVDVHTPDTAACLDCTHGTTGPDEWARFVNAMAAHYDIPVTDDHRPDYTRETT